MNVENFYKVEVAYEKGSFFEDDVITEYYKDYQMGKCTFEEFEKRVYYAFDVRYDSAEIMVHTDICTDNVMVTTVSAKNEFSDKSDRCVIKFKTLDMYV